MKTLLNQYCQQYKIPLPVYVSSSVNTGKVSPEWTCTLTFKEKSYTSLFCPTKKQAEEYCAKLVMESLTSPEISERINSVKIPDNSSQIQVKSSPRKVRVYIDMDNQQNSVKILATLPPINNTEFIGVMSKSSSVPIIDWRWVKKFVIEHTLYHDAVDTYICMKVGYDIAKGEVDEIMLVSLANFAVTTAATSLFFNDKIQVTCHKSITEVIDIFKGRGLW